MARKKKASPVVAPPPKVEPEYEPGPLTATEVEDQIGDCEDGERVNATWREAYKDLYDMYISERDEREDVEESLERLRTAQTAAEDVVEAAREVLDRQENAPMDAVFPVVLLTLKDMLRTAMARVGRIDE